MLKWVDNYLKICLLLIPFHERRIMDSRRLLHSKVLKIKIKEFFNKR